MLLPIALVYTPCICSAPMLAGESIGGRIRAARLDRDMSQAALARSVGVKPVSAWRWETGRIVPSVKRLEAICAVLHISLDRLVTSEPS